MSRPRPAVGDWVLVRHLTPVPHLCSGRVVEVGATSFEVCWCRGGISTVVNGHLDWRPCSVEEGLELDALRRFGALDDEVSGG